MGLAHSMLDRIKRAAAKNEIVAAADVALALQIARRQGVFEATITNPNSKHYNPTLVTVIGKVPGGYEAIPPADDAQLAAARVDRADRQRQFWANREAEKRAKAQAAKPKAKARAVKAAPKAPKAKANGKDHAASVQELLKLAANR